MIFALRIAHILNFQRLVVQTFLDSFTRPEYESAIRRPGVRMKPEEQLQAPIQTATAPKDAVRDQDKIMLVLCYLGILSLIPLLTVNDSDFVKWHAKNGLVLGLTAMIVIALLQFSWTLGGQFLACVGFCAFLVVTVVAISKAMKGERWRIPMVTALAEKL